MPSVDAALPGSPRARSCGTKTWSRVASERGRLASSECTGIRPASAAGTTNAPMSSPARAMTTTSVVPSAARTPNLTPVRSQPPSAGSAVIVTSSSAQARGWSASATVPAMAPEATAERKRCCCSGVPTSRTMGANWVTVARSGPGAMARPSSSTTTAVSRIGQADAPELLGDGEGGPVEGHHGAPQLFGSLTGLDDGADDIDGALLLEERADGGTQFFLLIRELELHRTPFPAVPVAFPTPCPRPRPGSGRVYLTPLSVSGPRATFTTPCCLGRTWAGCALGGRRSEAQARTGDAGLGATRGSAIGECPRPSRDTEVRSPTLSGAPLAQRQSNGLLIRRFRVRIPRGALDQNPSSEHQRPLFTVSLLMPALNSLLQPGDGLDAGQQSRFCGGSREAAPVDVSSADSRQRFRMHVSVHLSSSHLVSSYYGSDRTSEEGPLDHPLSFQGITSRSTHRLCLVAV